jgi:hypothetical protein
MNINTSETNILKILMLKLSKRKVSIFRNNVGTGWVGKAHKVTKPTLVYVNGQPVNLKPGDIVIREPRPLQAGLHKGSSDLIGWKTVEITTEMIGKKVAVFCSIEGKKHNGRVSSEQAIWIQNIRNAGGIAGVSRSEDEVDGVLMDWFNKITSKP